MKRTALARQQSNKLTQADTMRLLVAALLQAMVHAAQPTRRRALISGIASAAVPAIAQARVRGAAELDAEYYARRAFEKVTNTSPDVFDARRARAAPVAAAATGAARARRASKTSGLVLVTFSNALRA